MASKQETRTPWSSLYERSQHGQTTNIKACGLRFKDGPYGRAAPLLWTVKAWTPMPNKLLGNLVGIAHQICVYTLKTFQI